MRLPSGHIPAGRKFFSPLDCDSGDDGETPDESAISALMVLLFTCRASVIDDNL